MQVSKSNRADTIADVAKRAGVSIATVSRVINRTAPVSSISLHPVHFSRHLTPLLTTVHAPIETARHEAVRQLVRLIRTGHADPLVPPLTEVVICRSCGCS